MMKIIFLFIPLFVSLIVTSVSHAEPMQLKLGILSGLNGAAAKWNRYQNMGITLAQEEFNAQGWKIDLITEDSETISPKAISAFNKLLAFDKVQAIIANDFGFVLAPLLPLVRQRKVPLVALSLPQQHYCDQGGKYFYSMGARFELSRNAYEQFLIQNPDIKSIALVVFDDPEWGNSYRKIWTEIAETRGVKIVDTFLNNEWSPDFKSALTKIFAKKPDAIFQAHEPITFIKTVKQLGYKGKVVIGNHVFEMVADSNGASRELEGVYVVDPVITDDFRQRFEKRFNVAPILEAYAGYEAVRALINAFDRDAKNPQLAMTSVRYQGVAGPVDFTQTSCAGNYAEWGLFRFEADGKPKLIWKK